MALFPHRENLPKLYSLLAAIALIYALLAGLKTVVDFDLGWQMATGRYILAHHIIPRTESFSYTAHGVDWIYPILSGIVFYVLFLFGNYTAISWLCALTCVACTALLIHRKNLSSILLAILAVPVFASEIMPRASLFTILLFTAFARILIDHFTHPPEAHRTKLYLLPALMLLWVNLHTGFIAGIALIAAYILVEALETPFPSRRAPTLLRLKQSLPWLLATACITLFNPWGPRIFLALTRQQSALKWQSAFVEEWSPVQLANAFQELNWRNPDSAHWWLLAFGLILAIALLWRRQIGPSFILLFAICAFLRHQRMEAPCIILICLIASSALAHTNLLEKISDWRDASLNDRTAKVDEKNPHAVFTEGAGAFRPLNLPDDKRGFSPGPSLNSRNLFTLALASLLLALTSIRSYDLITNRTYLPSGDITLFGTGPSWWLPERATAFLQQNHLQPQVFSSFNLSSYLIWQLGPQYPDFADGRYIPFGEQIFDQQRTLTALPLDSPQWTQAAQTYNINTIIFPISRLFALGESPLLADCQSKLWTPIYLDTTAIIFQRKATTTQPTPNPINCITQTLLPPTPLPANTFRQRAEAYQQYANASAIYGTLRRFPEARAAAQLAGNIYPNDPTLHFIKAQTALGTRQYDEAEAELQAALKLNQSDAAWYNLALLYLSEHRLTEAAEALQNSARFSTESYNRHLLTAKIYLAEQQPQQALTTLDKALQTSPYATANTPAAADFRDQIAKARSAAYTQLQQP